MADGYRVSKTVNDLESRYLWDNDDIVADMNGNNVISHKYYRGVNLICDDSNNYYMHDSHGNIIETYVKGDNYCYNWYRYNAFGTNKHFDDTDDVRAGQPWGYCDQYYDWETQNYYMRARYYNPASGRFITEDPVKDGSNWYSYCGGNPVALLDVYGLESSYIALREWINDRDIELDYISSQINWNSKTDTATAVLYNSNNNTSKKASFTAGKDGNYIKNGRIYVDIYKLWSEFGTIIEPGLEINQTEDTLILTGVIVAAVKTPKLLSKVLNNSEKLVPQKAKDLVSIIEKNNGTPPKGYKGGKIYHNTPKAGEAKLPEGITYREYDVNPKVKGVPRDSERIVIGSDGSVWYTNDHYKTFVSIKR